VTGFRVNATQNDAKKCCVFKRALKNSQNAKRCHSITRRNFEKVELLSESALTLLSRHKFLWPSYKNSTFAGNFNQVGSDGVIIVIVQANNRDRLG
jgi:hypothetical protein